MFLLLCLGVLAVVFWLSTIVAEAFMTSPSERALPTGARVGFGFVLTLVFFSAAWQLMTIGQAWILALVLMALYGLARFGRPTKAKLDAAGRHLRALYARTFAAFLGAGVVFFMPLVLAWSYGPFTEGGGDVSIYADTAKYMVDRGLTEFGLPSHDMNDVRRNLVELVLQGGGERPGAEKSALMNPPFPEYGAYRILVTRTMSPFLYAPYATYSFMALDTNYHVFYGVSAFVYAALLAAVWGFFGRYGRRTALVGTVVTALSHSIISIYYNTYGAQGIALMMSALVLAALASVRLFGWAALRTYACVIVVTWINYVHYLSVILPMVCVAVIPAGAALQRVSREALSAPRRAMAVLAPAVFLLGFATLAWAGTLKSLHIGTILMKGAFASRASKEILTYMGVPVEAFGTQWFAFLIGIASQQHFMPYAGEYPPYLQIVRVAAAAATACFVIGVLAMLRWAFRRHASWRPALQDAAIYLAAIATIAIHLYLVRSSLYTQAKGAQNVLILVYTVLVLPLALLYRDMPAGTLTRLLRRTLEAALVVMAAMMLIVRSMFGVRLGLGLDRSGILDRSFFTEVRRIRAGDPKPLVLFEPRKSADLYTSNQPFFGARMLPTRELILQKSIVPEAGYYDSRIAMAVEFIEPADLPHVWTLRTERRHRWPILLEIRHKVQLPEYPYLYKWRAERLVDRKTPVLVLSGDTFERPYGERPLGGEKDGRAAPFSFMRNGVVSIYLPGAAVQVEVEVQPRDGEYPLLEPAIRQRFQAGEFGPGAKMTGTGKVVRLSYSIPATGAPSLRNIMRHKGEFFVNVRVDGKDLE